MSGVVTIKFTGDTAGLANAVMQSTKSLEGFSSSVSQAAGGVNAINTSLKSAESGAGSYSAAIRDSAQTAAALASVTGSVVDIAGSFIGRLRDIFVIAASGVYITKEVGSGLAAVGVAAGQASYTLGSYGMALEKTAALGVVDLFRAEADAISTLDGAMIAYFTSAAYAQRGTEMFTVANEGLRASIGRSIIATTEWFNFSGRLTASLASAYNPLRLYASGIDAVQISAIAASGSLGNLSQALGAANQPELPFLVGLTAQLEQIPGVTDAAATSIIAMLTTMPSFSTGAMDTLTQFLQTFAKTSDEAVKLTKTMTDAFHNPVNGGEVLGDLAKQVQNVEAQLKLAALFAKQLGPDQAVQMYDRIQQNLKDSRALIEQQDADHRRVLSTLVLENEAEEGAARLIQQQLDLDKQRTAEMNLQILRLEATKQGYMTISEEMKKQKDYRAAIDSADTPTSKINDLNATRDTLKSNTRRDYDDDEITTQQRDAAIRLALLEAANQTDEGLLAVFNVMKNRLNATYGNYGDNLGDVISKKSAFSAYDPDKMSAINPGSFQYKRAAGLYDKTFGEGAADDPTGGATHYYNPSSANPSWGSSMGNQKTIGDHRFGNADGLPVPSEDDSRISKEKIAETNTAIREQNVLLSGGTEEEKQATVIAQEGLTSARDAVEEAQKLVDVRKNAREASRDGTPQEQARADKALVQAQQALLDQQAAQEKASSALRAAQAQEGSRQRLDIQTAELAKEQGKFEEGSSKYLELEKQKLDLTKAYEAQQAANATELENAKHDAAERGFKQQQELIKEEAKTRGISSAEEQTQLTASYAAQATAARAHFAELERINAQNPAMVRKYALQAAIETNKIDEQRVASARAANQQIEQSYKSAFESVGSTVSSSLMAILARTGTFRDLMRNVARNITQQFLDAGVKMVADWAAHQALMVVRSAAAQSLQTTVVAAGEAARTAAVSAGQATQTAVQGTGIIRAILGSASETFAGIFGFLSPIMGPAAAGPAAAGQATVAGMASFAVGAWSLPSDMIAQVHAGEMIVPAGPAAMMRAAAGSSSSTGGSSAGGDTHLHFNVSAWDGGSVKSWLANGGARLLTKAIDQHRGLNPSLRRS